MTQQIKIVAEHDEHVFIHVVLPYGHPDISLDIFPIHGHRSLGVRVEGMTIASLLLDVKETAPRASKNWVRYCPFCGEELNMFSSKPHECKE